MQQEAGKVLAKGGMEPFRWPLCVDRANDGKMLWRDVIAELAVIAVAAAAGAAAFLVPTLVVPMF
jgi:hypothetical protein